MHSPSYSGKKRMFNDIIEDYISEEWKGLSGTAKKNLRPGVDWVLRLLDKKEVVPRCKTCDWCYVSVNRKEKDYYCVWHNRDVDEEEYCSEHTGRK